MNITIKVPKIKRIRYAIPPFFASSNMFAKKKLNYVSVKFTNTYKQTIESRTVIINDRKFQRVEGTSKFQQCM